MCEEVGVEGCGGPAEDERGPGDAAEPILRRAPWEELELGRSHDCDRERLCFLGRSPRVWAAESGELQPAWAFRLLGRAPRFCTAASASLLLASLLALLLRGASEEPRQRPAQGPEGGRGAEVAGLQEVVAKEEIGGLGLTFPLSFEDDPIATCPKGWACTGPAAVCSVGSSEHPCKAWTGVKGQDGQHFLDVGNDWGTASAVSPHFKLPKGMDRLCFKRSGGAGPGSGLYLRRKSDGRTICAAENGEDSNVFSEQCCSDLHRYEGAEVVINIVDAQSSGWGKVLIDDIRLLDTTGRLPGERSPADEAAVPACGLYQEDVHYDGVQNLDGETMSTSSAEACCAACQNHPHCDAWGWGKVRNNWLSNKCFLKSFMPGRMPSQVAWPGVVSGLPAKSMQQIKAGPLNASEYVEQDGAHFPSGSTLRLYALGSSSMLWMNWIEELHLYLLRLGYTLPTVEAKVKAEFHPRSVQTCDDSLYFDRLRTARFARIGWCSWDFSQEGWSDCGSDGYRVIGGHRVKCQHGPGCSHSMDPVRSSEIAEDASMSDITLVATWFNDDQQRWSNFKCFEGTRIDEVEATQLSIPSLLRTVRTIHERNPKVWVVVLGKYPQVWGHFTYPWFKEVNERVKAALLNEPRTLFIDYYMPPDNVTNLYQSAHPGHPNCRGSKLITMAVLRKLFEERIIGRGVRLQEPSEANLVRRPCESLTPDACHTSVICWVDPADRMCKSYSRGSDDAHAVVGF